MSKPITEADLDGAVSRLFGRKTTMPLNEAAMETALAEAFGRDADPQAVEAKRRVELAQEAVKDLAPWRAAVRWDQYDELCALEERFAELSTSRRGQTLEASRSRVGTVLREAWAKAGPSQRERFAAVEKAVRDGIAQLERLAPIVPDRGAGAPKVAERWAQTRVTVTEADANRAIGDLFRRDRNASGEVQR